MMPSISRVISLYNWIYDANIFGRAAGRTQNRNQPTERSDMDKNNVCLCARLTQLLLRWADETCAMTLSDWPYYRCNCSNGDDDDNAHCPPVTETPVCTMKLPLRMSNGQIRKGEIATNRNPSLHLCKTLFRNPNNGECNAEPKVTRALCDWYVCVCVYEFFVPFYNQHVTADTRQVLAHPMHAHMVLGVAWMVCSGCHCTAIFTFVSHVYLFNGNLFKILLESLGHTHTHRHNANEWWYFPL